jgi:hypothetical protein
MIFDLCNNKFNLSHFVALVSLAIITQFTPLFVDIGLQGSPLEDSLRSVSTKVTAGFCLGCILLIFIDLLVDAVMKQFNYWYSKSFYFWVPLVLSILVLQCDSLSNIGAIFISYSSASLVFYAGRTCFELHLNDTTKCWSLGRCSFFICWISVCQSIINFSQSHSEQSGLRLIAAIIYYVCIAMFSMNCLTCVQRMFAKNSTSITILQQIKLFSHEELIVIMLCISLPVALIFGTTLSIFTGDDFSNLGSSSPRFVCGRLIIQCFLSCTLALVPSLFLKHKAYSLQLDLDLKSLFVRSVSHEIRTPMNIALCGLDVLLRSRLKAGNRDTEEEDIIVEIIDSCKVAVTILDDLLSYEKVSTGVLTLDKAPVPVAAFLKASAALFNIQARSKEISMTVLDGMDAIRDDVEIDIDYGKMTQVIRNFISNAIKFTPVGGNIQLNAYERPDKEDATRNIVVIQVIDSGNGMTPVQLSKIFSEIIQFDANKLQGMMMCVILSVMNVLRAECHIE